MGARVSPRGRREADHRPDGVVAWSSISSRPNGPDWIEGNDAREQELWDEHAAFMDRLFEAGRVVLGGRLSDETGALLVMDAESEDHVRELLASDPWCVERDMLRVGAVRAWKIFLDARER